MASDPPLPDRWNKEIPMFFKIVLNPEADKLRIPPEFIPRLGCNLPKCVSLRVPNGSMWWSVELSHDSNAQTWLCKGWPEFRQHYSVGLGHLLLFDYDGNSCFNVHIFDTSATEIEYEQYESNGLPPNHGKLQKISSHVRTGSRISPPAPDILPDHVRVKLEEGNEDAAMEKVETERVQRGGKKNFKYAAHKKALASMSHKLHQGPYCIVVMHPSYIRGSRCYPAMPRGFPEKGFPRASINNLILRDSEGRTWPVKCLKGRKRVKLTTGWRKFAEDNLIKLYDACLFQVDNRSNQVWDVTIFRC